MFKKIIKSRILVTLMVLILSFALMTGCNPDSGKETGSDSEVESGEIKTYDIVMANHGVQAYTSKPKYYDDVMNAINEKLAEDLGFKINIEFVALPDDTYAERINLDLAVGKTYDLIRFHTQSVLADYYEKGMLEDITELLNSTAPNIMANIPENVWDEVSIENKILAVPLPAFPITMGNGWIRGDMLEKANMEMPTTRSEFENLLSKFKAENILPWAIPINNIEATLLGTFTETPGDFADANGNVMPKYFDPGYKEYVSTLKDWYSKGYIDNFLFDGNEETAISVYSNNSAAIIGANQWQLEWGALKGVNESRPEIKTTFFPQLDGDMKAYMSGGVATAYLFVPTTSKNKEIAMKYLDWALYNEENYSLVTQGIEGKTFEIKEGTVVVPEAEKADGINTPADLMGYFMNGYNFEYNMKYLGANVPEESKIAYAYCSTIPLDKVYVPITTFLGVSLDDNVRMDLDEANSIAREYIADIIRGRKDISAYDEMLVEFEKAGGMKAYEKYTEVYKNK